uniref:FGFR1 oncogene partner (FOP) N-terminal dimerisation domain-containing protein n=1 Tax=Tetradesmus obliquus TaxID=3088 RepID=A0A383VY64_TETOB|eukprot:jgi/Sobl393_1/2189/SZX70418.1
MDIIKERVTQVLDSKGVLTRLKAELRANVFLAINDQDIQNGGVGLASKSDGRHREQLLRDPAGVVLVELVRDFLRWSNLQFTNQVFEPEMQLATPPWDRSSLEQHVGLAGGDASAPLLLQLLNQHMGQPQAPLPTYMAAQQAAAAAAPEYRRSSNADLAVPQPLQPQTAGYAAAAAAKQRASKSGSYVDDVEEDLLAAGMLHSGQSHEEEEYAAVFVAAQPRSGGSGTESDGGSSSSGRQFQEQQSRPVRDAHASIAAALPQQQVPSPAAAGELSESFGHLDRSPAAMSLELHGLDSPPAQYTATAAGGAEASSPGGDAAGSSRLSSPSASMEQQQGSVASPPVASMPGRLGPLAALRPNKLAPLPAVKGPVGSISSSSRSPGAPDDLREELRRVGLLGASAADASPGASSNGSPVYGAAQQHTLYYGSGHDLESPGSSMAASAINTREMPPAGNAAAGGGAGSAGLSMAPGVYGSAAGGVDFGSDSSSDDDDFGIAEQRQLFEAARRQLSQSSQGGGQQVPQQQQRLSVAAAAAQWEDDDGESVSDVDIPEDLSVPLEGLDAGDYSEVFRAGAGAEQPQQQAGSQSAAAAAAREQHGLSMDLHETGLSVSDRPGGIGLESADFRIDDDDF